ncbi:arginase family protein [Klebsiella pneumoniae subsp. pneumoniae]|nr:arginase family protein [Klebsiella pneumoniae subsp. pneumoniae]
MNFMPYESDADWVITGVPFDMATSGRAGGRHGPAAIRQVSTNLAWEHNRFPWNFGMRERLNVVDCGDLGVRLRRRARNEREAAGSRREATGGRQTYALLWRRPLRYPAAAALPDAQALW